MTSMDEKRGKWVWLDLEMTGLNDKTCAIIQAAIIITDGKLNELETKDIVIWQPESVLETMGPFVRKMHTDNGLLDRVRKSQVTLADAEQSLLKSISDHVPYRRGILAGNTIWQDRRFLLRYMPAFEQFLHYRMIDVSTIKILSHEWWAGKKDMPQKKSAHTALEDIRASIAELKHYKAACFQEMPE